MHIMCSQVHHVVDREADYDDHRDTLTDTELPAAKHHNCDNGHDDEDDRDDCVERDQQVSRRYQQDEESADGGDRHANLNTIEEGLLALHPRPEHICLLVDNLEALRCIIIRKVLHILIPAFSQRELFSP